MTLARDWNHGGSAQIPGHARPGLRDLLNGMTGLASLSVLKDIPANERSEGQLAYVIGGGTWRFSESSVLVGDDLLVAEPTAGDGAWLRHDRTVDLRFAVSFANTDAQVLYTVPAGFELYVPNAAWEVTADWTGGSSSAIGLSSSSTFLNTKGDILGGAAGDVLATLVSTGRKYKGTIGADVGKPGAVLVGGDTIRFDRITSAFTTGTGFAHVFVSVIAAPAA
jgi:hypothetical protein